MEKVYLQNLDDLKALMTEPEYETRYAGFSKIWALTIMNMRLEKMLFDRELERHPYHLAAEYVDDARRMFALSMEVAFIEEPRVGLKLVDDSDVVEKHHKLWQEIWPRHDDSQFQKLIDFRGRRLDANDIPPYFEGKDCVDFGCGGGSLAFALMERGAKSVYGLDFGEAQVKSAAKNAARLGFDGQTTFVVGNVLDTGLADDSFDFAVASAVFHHLESKSAMEAALSEVARVLRPGGGFFYYIDGAGAISHDFWDASVDILAGVSAEDVEAALYSFNPTREKMTHLVDALKATYIHSTSTETEEMLRRCGFDVVRRLISDDETSWDINVVEADPYGVEKFGSGELRYLCVRA